MPFSVLAVKGNKFHARPAWTDASVASACAVGTTKCHVRFFNDVYRLGTASTTFRTSNKGFCSPPTDEDDLYVVADTVCRDYSAAEEASTEDSGASKRSDKAEVGSPAALPQKTSRSVCTKRPTLSSRTSKTIKRVLTVYLDS